MLYSGTLYLRSTVSQDHGITGTLCRGQAGMETSRRAPNSARERENVHSGAAPGSPPTWTKERRDRESVYQLCKGPGNRFASSGRGLPVARHYNSGTFSSTTADDLPWLTRPISNAPDHLPNFRQIELD
jgi:hypothetical protein